VWIIISSQRFADRHSLRFPGIFRSLKDAGITRPISVGPISERSQHLRLFLKMDRRAIARKSSSGMRLQFVCLSMRSEDSREVSTIWSSDPFCCLNILVMQNIFPMNFKRNVWSGKDNDRSNTNDAPASPLASFVYLQSNLQKQTRQDFQEVKDRKVRRFVILILWEFTIHISLSS
jgi:hypothetical protein